MTVSIQAFMKRHYRHFNAAVVVEAAEAYRRFLEAGGRMMVSLAGAMSTARLGISLAEMIRRDKIHAISCTGANLEEDLFNLVETRRLDLPDYRFLTPEQEKDLYDRQLHRVTDTSVSTEAMRSLEGLIGEDWMACDREGSRFFPHEFMYRCIRVHRERLCQADPADSWLMAACNRDLPIFVPGWEDSTLGNAYASLCIQGKVGNVHTVRSGMEYMMELVRWYREASQVGPFGFFQIGGGIAGDFAICVVPLIREDLKIREISVWGYFCQISDSTTSYGSYSGAVPNEKITWGKLNPDTPRFIIESDATIVAPLIFSYLLEDSP
jgi:deoxyhypusine synthase